MHRIKQYALTLIYYIDSPLKMKTLLKLSLLSMLIFGITRLSAQIIDSKIDYKSYQTSHFDSTFSKLGQLRSNSRNEDDLLILMEDFEWDTLINNWSLTLEQEYDYDENKFLSEIITTGEAWWGFGVKSKITIENDDWGNDLMFYFEESNASGLQPIRRVTSTFNSAHLVTSSIEERYWLDEKWQTDNVYDNNFNLTETTIKLFDSSIWTNGSRNEYEYDSSNNQTLRLLEIWDSTGWKGKQRDSYSYDMNNNQIQSRQERNDSTGWYNYEQDIREFDVNNNKLEVLRQYWNNTDWENSHITLRSYDQNKNLTEILSQVWADSIWINTSEYLYEYTLDNQLKSSIRKTWSITDSNWKNQVRAFYDYNLSNLLTIQLNERWENNTWQPIQRWLLEYDSNSNLALEIYQSDFLGSGIWINQMKTIYYYQVENNLSNESQKEVLFKVFPNPNPGEFFVDLKEDFSESARISVFNSNGQEIMSDIPLTFGTRQKINLNHFPTGYYILQISAQDSKMTQSVIVTR